MTTDTHFDLVIIGGGPAGTRCAFRASAAGMKTALIESGFMGGTCLNVGCIPTKFLLGGTASIPLLAMQRKYKTAKGNVVIDLASLQSRKDRFIKGSRQSLEKQLGESGVTLFHGKASFSGPQTAAIKSARGLATITFSHCIIAIGSVPSSFPGLKPDGATVKSSAGLLSLASVPESLIIVGGGAIGLELGELYHRLGSRIILVEGASRILPGEEPEVSAALHSHLSREGWKIFTERRITSVVTEEGLSVLRLEDGEELRATSSLIAIGRRSDAACLNPATAGIELTERGWIATDANLRCSEHIFAVGDINGRTLLAHAADHQARYVVDVLSGTLTGEYTHPPMPSCVYGTMEVMRVGPTLSELMQKEGRIQVSQAQFAANAIAQSYGHTHGFARMLWKDGALASISAVGHGASHLVSAAALLVGQRQRCDASVPLIFAHPTLDEVLESAMVGIREDIR